jgi:hypothetical protein
MEELKMAAFGCWNVGCKKDSGQESVVNLLKSKEAEYNFMIILGDNYYPEKINLNKKTKVKQIESTTMKAGFDCLDKINITKKIIMGNHDIEDGVNQGCSILKYQLKLPWYDVKFPFGYEFHHINSASGYSTLLVLYIDTNLYTNSDMPCYNQTLNKPREQLKDDQTYFIVQTLSYITSMPQYKINNVMICGHEPLITYKYKEGKEKSAFIPELLDLLFIERGKYIDTQFTYVCADLHVYQYSTIENSTNNQVINQIILGTGGGELDDLVPNNKSNVIVVDTYTLTIYPSINGTNGISQYGYGELIYNKDGLTHNFISIDNPSYNISSNDTAYHTAWRNSQYDSWYNKYLKYKNKYLKLKEKL